MGHHFFFANPRALHLLDTGHINPIEIHLLIFERKTTWHIMATCGLTFKLETRSLCPTLYFLGFSN